MVVLLISAAKVQLFSDVAMENNKKMRRESGKYRFAAQLLPLYYAAKAENIVSRRGYLSSFGRCGHELNNHSLDD